MERTVENKRRSNFLTGLIALIHVSSAVLVMIDFFPKLTTDTLFFALYIIVITFFWSFYIYLKYKSFKKKYDDTKSYQDNIIGNKNDEIRLLKEKADKLESLSRKARYAEALTHINNGIAHINDSCRDHLQHSITGEHEACIKKYMGEFGNLCTGIERAFSMITGFNCSVCIKLFVGGEDASKASGRVFTLIRDINNEAKRKHPKEKDVKHWVRENTAYRYIFDNLGNPECRSFFSNSLPFDNYNNTSSEIYGRSKRTRGMTELQVIEAWKLPYKSTIVTAICPNLPDKFSEETILGFLCVDCPELDAFNADYDTMLMVGNADAIYNSVKIFLELCKITPPLQVP